MKTNEAVGAYWSVTMGAPSRFLKTLFGQQTQAQKGIKVWQGSPICILTGPAFFVLTRIRWQTRAADIATGR